IKKQLAAIEPRGLRNIMEYELSTQLKQDVKFCGCSQLPSSAPPIRSPRYPLFKTRLSACVEIWHQGHTSLLHCLRPLSIKVTSKRSHRHGSRRSHSTTISL